MLPLVEEALRCVEPSGESVASRNLASRAGT